MFSRTNAYVFQSSSCKTGHKTCFVVHVSALRLHRPHSARSMADTTTRALLLFSSTVLLYTLSEGELSVDHRRLRHHHPKDRSVVGDEDDAEELISLTIDRDRIQLPQ